jgi:hypothetical protein
VFEGEDGDALLAPTALTWELRRDSWIHVASDWGRFLVRHRTIPHARLGVRSRLGLSAPLTPPAFPSWLEPDFVDRLALRQRYDAYWDRYAVSRVSCHPLVYRLSNPVWQAYLESLEPGVSGINLEARLPLLDTRLVDFALALPGLPWKHGKYLFRAAMQGELPSEILTRRKVPARGLWAARMRQLSARGWRGDELAEPSPFIQMADLRDDSSVISPELAGAAMRACCLTAWLRQWGYARHARR